MSINCKGELLWFDRPKVMGILNCTPDSFYDGGKYAEQHQQLLQVEKMLEQGASIIDIGAYSSKPNAQEVSLQEELKRLLEVVKNIEKHFPKAILSVDTFRSEVAKAAIEHGASIINDISGGNLDSKMFEVVGKYKVPYILMHMKGTPQTMQSQTNYTNFLKEVVFYFSEQISKARACGVLDIIIDPGFGFAKTLEQNYFLLNHLEKLKFFEFPILSALSRKSMIYKALENSCEEALNGTTVLNTISLVNGANLLRVHDVKEAVECIQLFEKLKACK